MCTPPGCNQHCLPGGWWFGPRWMTLEDVVMQVFCVWFGIMILGKMWVFRRGCCVQLSEIVVKSWRATSCTSWRKKIYLLVSVEGYKVWELSKRKSWYCQRLEPVFLMVQSSSEVELGSYIVDGFVWWLYVCPDQLVCCWAWTSTCVALMWCCWW